MTMRIAALAAAVLALYCGSASAQTAGYPARALRIVVPLAPGGNVDLVVRALAQQMSETIGQQIIIENRPGASSLVGTQFVAKTPADGYTFLAIANTFATVPSIVSHPGYDPFKDF